MKIYSEFTKRYSNDFIRTVFILRRLIQVNIIIREFSFILQKCREIGYEIHEEVLKVLHELHTAMKTHHSYQTEFRTAESKLQVCSIVLITKKIEISYKLSMSMYEAMS